MVGISNGGDLFVWNKDTDNLKHIEGMKDFAYRLGFHNSSVHISDDATKVLLVTSRNKVFVFEADTKPKFATSAEFCGLVSDTSSKNIVHGTWSAVIAPNDIKTVEDNKELAVHARFRTNEVRTSSLQS